MPDMIDSPVERLTWICGLAVIVWTLVVAFLGRSTWHAWKALGKDRWGRAMLQLIIYTSLIVFLFQLVLLARLLRTNIDYPRYVDEGLLYLLGLNGLAAAGITLWKGLIITRSDEGE